MNAEGKDKKAGYWNFREVFTYFFKKRDPSSKGNVNLTIMHGINRLAIIIFLLGLVYLIVKYIFQ